MSEIKIGDHDNFEVALKRFSRKVQQDGILSEARRRMHFESAGQKHQREAAARRRKQQKAMKRDKNKA